jgi:FkbM family methyltransferase
VKFFSQVGQDRFLWENFFRGRRGGVFVDIGAYDGEKFSNTLFFERSMGWSGLCVEPLPGAFAKLKQIRRAPCEQIAVADFEGDADFVEADDRIGPDEKMLSGLHGQFDPRHQMRIAQTTKTPHRVKVTKLSTLLARHGLHDIDYCSIDVEGAELAVLSDFDPARFRVALFTIENNYDDERISKLMAEKGYDLVGQLEQDYVFKRKDVQRLPHTSIICAAWHKEPNRDALLTGHAENLAKQTVPVDPIYVLDGGAQPPAGFKGRCVSVAEELSIYQAWNVALSLVSTPLVMNLNLDDRLAPDAVEILENEIRKQQAAAIGGDWKICYSQDETDAVERCFPADRLAVFPKWPPPKGTPARLGSSRENSGTLGPATMWRVDAHMGAPRFPWRFNDGTPVKVAGDLAWWLTLSNTLRYRVVPLPLVIGNYHSHPDEQAEFRTPDERPLFGDPGVSLI